MFCQSSNYHLRALSHIRIKFKVDVITLNVLTTYQPSYLSELLQYKLSSRLLKRTPTKQKFTDRVFQLAFQHFNKIWNTVPTNITSNPSSLSIFNAFLKLNCIEGCIFKAFATLHLVKECVTNRLKQHNKTASSR